MLFRGCLYLLSEKEHPCQAGPWRLYHSVRLLFSVSWSPTGRVFWNRKVLWCLTCTLHTSRTHAACWGLRGIEATASCWNWISGLCVLCVYKLEKMEWGKIVRKGRSLGSEQFLWMELWHMYVWLSSLWVHTEYLHLNPHDPWYPKTIQMTKFTWRFLQFSIRVKKTLCFSESN